VVAAPVTEPLIEWSRRRWILVGIGIPFLVLPALLLFSD
jgi:hypothetical protein